MRLIDADAIPSLFDEKYKETKKRIRMGVTHLDNLAEGFAEAHYVVLMQPTIESEPVRHGKWTYDFRYRRMAQVDAMLRCSECGLGSYVLIGEMYTYCPLCGAKMDGGTHGN